MLPGVTPKQARKLAERLRTAVEQMPLSGIDGVTASIGVSALGKDYSFEAMFAEADRRLDEEGGRAKQSRLELSTFQLPAISS